MGKLQFTGKYKNSYLKTLAIFLTMFFILSMAYETFARGGRGGGRRGGGGSVRHHRVVNHSHDRDRNKQNLRHNRHNRRHHNGSVRNSNSYDYDDDYNSSSCNEYGRNCVYDHYYDRCDCD